MAGTGRPSGSAKTTTSQFGSKLGLVLLFCATALSTTSWSRLNIRPPTATALESESTVSGELAQVPPMLTLRRLLVAWVMVVLLVGRRAPNACVFGFHTPVTTRSSMRSRCRSPWRISGTSLKQGCPGAQGLTACAQALGSPRRPPSSPSATPINATNVVSRCVRMSCLLSKVVSVPVRIRRSLPMSCLLCRPTAGQSTRQRFCASIVYNA
jgi:hypothetical protein